MGDLRLHNLDAYGCNVFIESGSGIMTEGRGGLNYACGYSCFSQLHTIEACADVFHGNIGANKDPRVTCWYGLSTSVLSEILPIPGKILFWLDGHFSNGADFGFGPYTFGPDDMPLERELEIIKAKQPNSCMIIDDADMLLDMAFELPGAHLPDGYVKPGIGWIEKLFPSHHIRIDPRHQGFIICSV